MSLRRTPISYRHIGHSEIWVYRASPSQIDVVVYDHIDRTEQMHSVTTLDEAMTQVSVAISRELRRQQGEV